MVELDNNKLRLIFAGIVLIVLTLAFIVFRSRFLASNQQAATLPPVNQATTIPVVTISPIATPSKITPTPTKSLTTSAVTINRGSQTLPATGFPEVLAGVFAISFMVIGSSLRKFPK